MAERRMFSKKITDSDAFIDLPSAAQALYFHLNQGADDDGFNNQIQAAIFKSHASVDDLKVLLAKNFVIRFESGVIVIKHWRMHNTLRKDRYNPTNFQEELSMLGIKDNGSYTLYPQDDERLPSGCQTVAKRLPQDSIDKDSIDKDSLIPPIVPPKGDAKPTRMEVLGERFERFWKVYPRKTGKGLAERSFIKYEPTEELTEQMIAKVREMAQTYDWQRDEGKYIPMPATWLNQKRWEDETNPVNLADAATPGKPIPQTQPSGKPQKPRYGNFDPDEALQRALERSAQQFAEDDRKWKEE